MPDYAREAMDRLRHEMTAALEQEAKYRTALSDVKTTVQDVDPWDNASTILMPVRPGRTESTMAAPAIKAFTYLNGVPDGYVCGDCGATGVRLYREYQTFLSHQHLRCTGCAEKAGSEPRKVDPENPDQIGWMVAAVPTEDGETFWGFSSVPQPGVLWWRSLPVLPSPAESP